MARGYNKVQIIGNVGSDPIVKNLDGGKKVANFSVAESDSYTNDAGEKVENTQWHNITAWSGLAGIVEKLVKKGSAVFIEGKIKYSSWEDKEGKKRDSVEIVAETINVF